SRTGRVLLPLSCYRSLIPSRGNGVLPLRARGHRLLHIFAHGYQRFPADRSGSATDGHFGNTGHDLHIRAVVGSTERPFRVWPKYDPIAPFYRSRPSVMARRNSQPKCRSLRTDLPAVAPDRG